MERCPKELYFYFLAFAVYLEEDAFGTELVFLYMAFAQKFIWINHFYIGDEGMRACSLFDLLL